MRDGTDDSRIPLDDTDNPIYGRHETLTNYEKCSTRERNKGLWIATERPGDTADNTRQNEDGTRYGLECTEERDYYPYWHPSEWLDIAVITSEPDRCEYYKEESQNVKAKYECLTEDGDPAEANNEVACEREGAVWTKVDSWGLDPPDCLEAPWQRDNHLGNTETGRTTRYNWTVPTQLPKGASGDACVLRVRYNISTYGPPGAARAAPRGGPRPSRALPLPVVVPLPPPFRFQRWTGSWIPSTTAKTPP